MGQEGAIDRSTTATGLLAAMRSSVQELAFAVDGLHGDAAFRDALEAAARFWRYSTGNLFMILMQRRTATRVTGRRAWEALGRRVLPAEKPIWICAPRRGAGSGIPFLPVPVYDIRQTQGKRLPKLDVTLRGRTRHVQLLETAATRLGISVGTFGGPSTANGVSQGGSILLHRSLSQRGCVATLAHELAHELLHQARSGKKRPPQLSHAVREAEAEAISFVVLRVLGLPSKAPAYIAWQGGSGKMLMASLQRIQRAARLILEAGLGVAMPLRAKRPAQSGDPLQRATAISTSEPRLLSL